MTTEFYRNKRVAVTGAGGFIGSHLVEALLEAGAELSVMVRYTSHGRRGHLEPLLRSEAGGSVTVIPGNVEDPGTVSALVEGADVVFHLAALIGIPYSYVAPHQYLDTNIKGTLHVLEAARRYGVKKLVHTSTSETYGTALYTPIDETHPLQGQSPYSATKIAADKLAESYFCSFELPVATIRPFNTYGPRQSSRAIIPSVMKQLAAGKTKILIGSRDPSRDLNFVADTVAGFMAVGESDATVGQVTNIGSGKTITIGGLCDLILEVSGKSATIEVDPGRVRPNASEVMMLHASVDKAAKLCGYHPTVTLREGLRRTYAYIEANLSAYRPDEYSV